MANYKKTSKGFETIEISREELIEKENSYGVCDSCNSTPQEGVYIAVLNMWYCVDCFEHWHEHARRYDEDIPTEKENIKFFSHLIFGSEPTGRRFAIKIISTYGKDSYIIDFKSLVNNVQEAKIFTDEKEVYDYIEKLKESFPHNNFNVIEL